MNLNFILAGRVSPSAFYVIIQLMLLNSNVGHVMGIDGLLTRWNGFRRRTEPSVAIYRYRQVSSLAAATLSACLSLLNIPFVKSFDPTASIEDPAMLLLILLSLTTV